MHGFFSGYYTLQRVHCIQIPYNFMHLSYLQEGSWPSSRLGGVSSLDSTRRGPGLLHVSCNKGDRRGLPQPGGCRALQPLGGGLRLEARRRCRADDHPGDCELRHRRSPKWRTSTPPSGGREGSGPPVVELRVLVDTSRQVVWLFAFGVKWDLVNSTELRC
ncbi:hypothetical protein VPH35_054186 [Triticum aestivum]